MHLQTTNSTLSNSSETAGGGSAIQRVRFAFWLTVALVNLALFVSFWLLWFGVVKI